jgi:choline dehydrogenase-like flavoprotein
VDAVAWHSSYWRFGEVSLDLMVTSQSSYSCDIVVVGAGWAGMAAAWLLRQSGLSVLVLEQGTDSASSGTHDRGIDEQARLGDHVTFRPDASAQAVPTSGGWAAIGLGGGSRVWGGWSFRPPAMDFKLKTLFEALGQDQSLTSQGYDLADWPVDLQEMGPFLADAESLLGVSGDSRAWSGAFEAATWQQDLQAALGDVDWLLQSGSAADLPCPALPIATPAQMLADQLAAAGYKSAPAPIAMRAAPPPGPRPLHCVSQTVPELVNDRVASTCPRCGGLYIPFNHPTRARATNTFLTDAWTERAADVLTSTVVTEISFDFRKRTATGVKAVRLLEGEDRPITVDARAVVLACGAVQTARLLLLSKGPDGVALGDEHGNLGRNAMFHIMGLLGNSFVPLDQEGRGIPCIGASGTIASADFYMMRDQETQNWMKGGVAVGCEFWSTRLRKDSEWGDPDVCSATDDARREELANADLELMVIGDDLPRPENRVDLDPHARDRFGRPLARLTRRFGPHELAYCREAGNRIARVLSHPPHGPQPGTVGYGRADLFGSHQMGTCRMGTDRRRSVTDVAGRLHEAGNVFVADSATFPTSLGVNPTLTIVANALRIASAIRTQIGVMH